MSNDDEFKYLMNAQEQAQLAAQANHWQMQMQAGIGQQAPPSNGGTKHDSGKLRWATLLPWRALESVVRVLEHGAAKPDYGADGWRHVPNARPRYLNAAVRHLVARLRGEVNDPDSKLPHLAHAACCVLFILELEA